MLDLRFVGIAVSRDGTFHFGWSMDRHRQPRAPRCSKGYAHNLHCCRNGTQIVLCKNLLDGNHFRMVEPNDAINRIGNLRQAKMLSKLS